MPRLTKLVLVASGTVGAVALLALIVLAYMQIANVIFPGSQYQVNTTSQRVVDIGLSPSQPRPQPRLRVSAAYLNWSPNLAGGEQDFVKLAAHWPDMRPISLHWQANPAPTRAEAQRLRIYSDELIEIEVRRRHFRGLREQSEKVLTEAPLDFELTAFGLYRYRWTGPRDGTYDPLYEVAGRHVQYEHEFYLMDPTEAGELIDFTCTLPIPREGRIFCYGRSNLTDGIAIEYRFRSAMLPQWRAIDAAVRELVQSMIVEGSTDTCDRITSSCSGP
jgi:hypothetical protein